MNKIVKTIPLKKVTIYSKQRISSELLNSENYIGTDNLLQNKKGKTLASYTPENGFVCKYEKGNILISNIRPYLKKIWYANETGGSSADVLTLVVNKNYDSRFVYYSLLRDVFFDYMMAGSKGTKMPRGDKSQVMNFPISNFDFKVQQKIASILSTLDAKIELNSKINTELENMVRALYDYWFVQFDFPDENGKPYKSSGGKMVWSEDLKREIPKEWAVTGLYKNSLTSILKPKIDIFEGSKEYLATANINGREIIKGDLITHENREARANMQPVVNSVWFAKMKASKKHIFVGKYSKDIIENNIFSTGFLGLKCEDLAFEYIASFISSDIFELTKDTISHGATMQGIGNDDLKIVKLVIPRKEVLMSYKKITEDVYKKIDLIRQENKKLEEVRDCLLPMLMNGQVITD
ncbi:MAG: restriction endonuclease subunit S [Clostridia bacterium]|nr:restriction endonuclease subunit S [Clostridia bacterium]